VLDLGRVALVLSLVFALAGIAFLAFGVVQRSRELIRNGYLAVYLFFMSVVVACAALLTGFLTKDFTFRYVADNSDESLGVFYRIAGFWAGKEGSFLFWLGLLALVTVVIALRDAEESDRLTATAVLVLCAISGFFAVLMIFDDGSDPFAQAAPGAVARGLNPLLLHPAMVLHPPALFAGYVGLAVPFAFAIAALALGRPSREWVLRSTKWTVAGWALLSLGIGLGAWWAYEELAFGGYWAWDPVENSSLIPWLTATALLHSMVLYRQRGVFKHWTLGLASLTFWLTIVATWVTRSGAIASVHAFEENTFLSQLFGVVLLVVLVVSVTLIAWRWRLFSDEKEFVSLASRDFLFFILNVVLTAFSVAVLFATVGVDLLFEKSVGGSTYQKVAEPLGVLTLALIAICPLMSWGRTEGRTFWRNVRIPLIVAALSVPLLLLTGDWRSSVGGMIGLVVCFFAAAAVVQFVVVTVRRAGVRRGLLGSRTRTAAYVAHFGMVLVLAGLLGSSVYKVQTTPFVDAKPGATATVGDYTLKFVEFDQGTGAQGAVSQIARFDVFRGDEKIGTAEPHFDTYPDNPMGQTAARTEILNFVGEDLFIAPSEFGEDGIQLQLDVFPLITLVWVGSVLLVVGAAVSLWPKPQPAAARADAGALVERQGEAA
jgi:cytochrome c-type biogenesis protein CcmF